jgi:hypothetical protein
MNIKLDTVQFSKSLLKSVSDQNLAYIGLNVVNVKLGSGKSSYASLIKARQGSWVKLAYRYKVFKKREGLDPRKWVATGKLLRAVSKPQSKIGTVGGIKIAYKKSNKTISLDISGAIGGAKKSKDEKVAILYQNDQKRELTGWRRADAAEVKRAIVFSLEEIFKKEGLKK